MASEISVGADDKRPAWLSYKARDGIFETFFKQGGGEEAFNGFIRKAILWSERSTGHYCLLDTFLSDTINTSKLEMLFRRTSPESPIHLLLADPQCHFAETRAAAIGELTAHYRATLGLRRLLGAAGAALEVSLPDLDGLEYDDALIRLAEIAPKISLELKFYDSMPSGPMFFFKDILLCGRYCTGVSSRDLPWLMIVDDPHRQKDMYDIFWNEFALIWSRDDLSSVGIGEGRLATLTHPSQKAGQSYFISYSWEDRRVADHVEILLRRKGRSVRRDEDRVKAGGKISTELRRAIKGSDTFLALCSASYQQSRWCTGELELALTLRDQGALKRVIVILLDDSELDAIRVLGDNWVSGQTRDQRIGSLGKILSEE